MTVWADFVALAEREAELVEQARWEDAAALSSERVRRARALPAAPPEALEHLRRLARLQAQLLGRYAAERNRTSAALGSLQRGRRALSGYRAAGLPAAAGRIDRRG